MARLFGDTVLLEIIETSSLHQQTNGIFQNSFERL